jgi:hypothetical protein
LDPKKLTDDEKLALKLLRDRIKECSVKFLEMDRGLPATTNGLYLNIILGSNLDVSILNADDRYRYKQGYESFKARVTYVILAMFFLALVVTFRFLENSNFCLFSL